MHSVKHNLRRTQHFLKWLVFSIVVGIFVGLIGVAFHYTLEGANTLRSEYQWILFFLPLAGLLIVWVYKKCKMSDDKGTNFILISIRTDQKLTIKTAPLIFISTVLTHLFGGSAGREGAALQLGASIADKLARIIRLKDQDKKIITMCGMAAAFSAVFGTPVSAAVFSMEVISVGVMYYAAFVPCMIASAVAYVLSSALGVHSFAYELLGIPAVNLLDLLRVTGLGMLCAGLSWLFCHVLKYTAGLYKRFLPNPYWRVATGGLLIVLLTLIVGSMDYNGAGSKMIFDAMGGHVFWGAFLLKILFTALTLGAGYKGGEIVPTFFVGSTFGCTAGGLLGLNPSFAAGLGMIGVFCGVTNCPMTSIMISIELFGAKGIVYFALMSALSYMLSGYTGLYSEQKIVYSKFRPIFIDKKVAG